MAAVSEEAKQHAREQQKRWREANKDRVRETNRKGNAARVANYRSRNPEAVLQSQSEYYERNKDAILAQNKIRRDSSDTHKTAGKRWADNNKPVVRAMNAARRAKLKNASVSWADSIAIAAIYKEAAALTTSTGVKHVVDHIIPLNSKLVCGLHCEANLQVITAEENGHKGNKLLPEFR